MWAPTACSTDVFYIRFARALQQVDAKSASTPTRTVSQSEANSSRTQAVKPGEVVLGTNYTIYAQETEEQFRASGIPRQSREETTDAISWAPSWQRVSSLWIQEALGWDLEDEHKTTARFVLCELCLAITVEAQSS